MIAVVDFGSGNTRSVLRALGRVGADARLATRPEELAGVERVVFPGVGAAGSAVRSLQDSGLWDGVIEAARRKTPLLGICLGAQLLLDGSDEDGAPGLGLVAGRCRAFPAPDAGGPRVVPHIGWNAVELRGGHAADAYIDGILERDTPIFQFIKFALDLIHRTIAFRQGPPPTCHRDDNAHQFSKCQLGDDGR